MTTYNTGNPVGSTEVKDLYDNAENLDIAINSPSVDAWTDRLGQARKTWRGIQNEAQLEIAQVVGEVTAQSQQYLDASIVARDEARAAASASGPIAFFSTYAAAQAAVGGLPADGIVEVSQDETRAGARTRYKVQAGALGFVVNLDQIRIDLAATDGAGMVGYGATTVATALASQSQALASQSQATGVASSGAIVGSVQSALDASLRSTRLRAVLDLQQRDATVLLQGDSTGNESWEFFYLAVLKLAAAYPTHTVSYRPWDPGTKTWGSVLLQTGTSGRTIRVYNGSVSGANPVYWHGANKSQAYEGFTFDLIVVNYGLNTAEAEQTSAACACLYTLRQDQPEADILMVLQPPDYTDWAMLARSQARSDAQRRVAEAYGVAVVDAFSLFAGLVNKTGNVGDWYIDLIHPNAAGQARWADIVFAGMLNTSSRQRPIDSSPTQLPNGNFTRWPNGSSAPPLWWEVSSSALRDTIHFESQGQAVRALGAGGAGSTATLTLSATEIINRMAHLPQIVIAARVRSSGTSRNPGTLYLAHSASTAFTDIRGNDNGYLGVGSGGFRWAFLVVPKSFYAGKSDFQIGIFSGDATEFVTVDRIIVSGDLVPQDSDGSDGFSYETSYSDDAFTVAANSVTGRSAVRPFAVLGAGIKVSCPPLPASVLMTAHATASTAEIRFANLSAAIANIPTQDYRLVIS